MNIQDLYSAGIHADIDTTVKETQFFKMRTYMLLKIKRKIS